MWSRVINRKQTQVNIPIAFARFLVELDVLFQMIFFYYFFWKMLNVQDVKWRANQGPRGGYNYSDGLGLRHD